MSTLQDPPDDLKKVVFADLERQWRRVEKARDDLETLRTHAIKRLLWSFAALTTLSFVIAKAAGGLDWRWYWVISPLWALPAAGLTVVIVDKVLGGPK